MVVLGWILLGVLAAVADADYTCVCSKGEELEVLDAKLDTANTIGTMAPGTCKEQVAGSSTGWAAVAYQHQVGFLPTGDTVAIQQCTGNPPDADKVAGGSTSAPMTSTAGMMTTTTGMMTTPPPASTTTRMMTTMGPGVVTTSGQQTTGSGNLDLCPVALRSFTASDGGVLAQYDKSCYEVVPRRTSWTYADTDCKTKGGHLMDITSAAEQAFIYNFLKTKYPHNVWIGLHDIRTEGNYEWITGANVSYTNWLPGRTTTYHNINDCVYLRPQNGGYWNEAECGQGPLFVPHAYICQYGIDTTVHGTVDPLGDGDSHMCPTAVQQHAARYFGNLGSYQNSCYELLPRYKVTWSHGERLCQQEGGHLVDIIDADEQRFVQEFMNRHMPDHAVWTGLNDGLSETNFQWSSGEPVLYTNWAPGHTNNFHSHQVEDCVLFLPYKNGLWDDTACGQTTIFGDAGDTHPILCEFRTTTSTQPAVQVIG